MSITFIVAISKYVVDYLVFMSGKSKNYSYNKYVKVINK